MNQKQAIEKAVKEMIDEGLINPYKATGAEFYLGLLYAIGFDSGSRSRSRQKPVIQLDKHGNVIQEFESASQAARVLKLDKSNISKVCNSEYHSAGGFLFKYKVS